jgi:hypothetical protein
MTPTMQEATKKVLRLTAVVGSLLSATSIADGFRSGASQRQHIHGPVLWLQVALNYPPSALQSIRF